MEKYSLQSKTIWRFEKRGDWNKSNYPGNFSPHVPRNIILKYSQVNDLVFDGFSGSGTTAVEAKILNRNSISCDINKDAVKLTKENLDKINSHNTEHSVLVGNSMNLDLSNNSIDLICTHPPYADIIKYSKNIKNDLSLQIFDDFLKSMEEVAKEYFRILKNNKICAITIGDIRKKGNIIPLGFMVLNCFLNAGFVSKEIIIKEQFNCSKTDFWEKKLEKMNILLINHEYIFILKKQN